MDEKGLGKRLQAARLAAGFSQQELCHKANLSFSTLTKIERGAIKSPSVFTVQAISEAVGVPIAELIGGHIVKARNLLQTKSGVRFVYFDVNGCLVHFYQRAFAKLAQASGAASDSVETAFWHYNDDVCRGDMSMPDFNAALADRLDIPEVDWLAYYLDTVEPITEMAELAAWAIEHYKVGLLTNIMPGQLDAMRASGALPALPYDTVIDSSKVGAIKPEARIYQLAQQAADCAPEEILFIDDSRANLMAAEKQGWRVLWFDDSRPSESVERVRQALEPAE